MSDCMCNTNPCTRERDRNPLCPTHGDLAQPLPTESTHPIAHLEVMKDLQARLDLGVQRYGQPLQPFNGRKSLRDAYEEALDMCVYLWTAMYEAENPHAV